MVAEHEPRLDAARIEGLLQRATEQADTLETLRLETSAKLFGAA
jgi:hypothetical protein